MSNIRPSVRVDDTHFSGMYLYDTYTVGHGEINPETVQHWVTHNLSKIESVMHVSTTTVQVLTGYCQR